MTRQEMFDKAVRGLRSQEFAVCTDMDDNCVYTNSQGAHCAWGWVDDNLSQYQVGSVYSIATVQGTIASTLCEDDLDWASALQRCHDNTRVNNLEQRLREFGERSNLVWPE